MAIATRQEKQQVIALLKNVNSKYAKPFDKGKMASAGFMAGSQEDYAQIVMGMVSADTLLDIDAQLERLNRNIEALVVALAPSVASG
jgi:hypothetical protein